MVTVSFSTHPGSPAHLTATAFDVLQDTSFVTKPIVTADWRSFGFGDIGKLKPKHKDILYQRILHGLDIIDGELRLTWVWVVEAREKKEKQEALESRSALAMQCSIRQALSRRNAASRRRRRAAAIKIQRQGRRVNHARIGREKREQKVATVKIQQRVRVRNAKKEVGEKREKNGAAVMLQKRARKRAAENKFEEYKQTTKAARLIQAIARMRQGYRRVAQIVYAREMEAKRRVEEAERAKENARMAAKQYAKDRAELAKREKELAHKRWLVEKNATMRKKLERERQEAEHKRIQEEIVKRQREENIEIYRRRLEKREREKRRKMRKAQRQLAAQGAEDPSSDGILPKLALALGKPLSNAFAEATVIRKNIKKGKKGGGKELPQFKGRMKGDLELPDYKRSAAEAELSRKALIREMKIVVKKSPKRGGKGKGRGGGGGSGGLPGIKGATPKKSGNQISGHERNKFFLSKKERSVLNAIDASPVQPANLQQHAVHVAGGEEPIEDWAVR